MAWVAQAGICEWWVAPLFGFTLAAVGGAAVWLWLIIDRNKLLWAIEKAAHIDLDRDGEVGQPEPREWDRPLIYVRDQRRDVKQREAADFRFFLQQTYGIIGPTWRAWDGIELPSGDKMTQPRWERYSDRLQDAGLAVRPHATAALELRSSYREALERFANAL